MEGLPSHAELQALDDAELVARARACHTAGAAGPETAKRCLALVFERHRDLVRVTCARNAPRAAVDDLEMSTYAGFLRTVYGGRTPIATPAGLLVVIARRVVADFHAGRPPEQLEPDPERLRDAPDDVDELAELAFADMLAPLDERQREVVTLRVRDGLPAAQVGELLGISAGNVHVILHRALARLREEAG
jgi:RNA polymerase sigma factor (sigma-70 family)